MDEESIVYFSEFTKNKRYKILIQLKSQPNEIRALIEAQKDNPVVDVIYGGTTDLYVSAKNSGLLENYFQRIVKQLLKNIKTKMDTGQEFIQAQ
jgi:ABC-type Fe3+ transport system substrate-binding protein